MPAIKITSENFESEVVNSGKTFLLDFWAPWCGPCKAMAPVVDAIAERFDGQYKFCKVNVDENKELAKTYNIMSIPTLIVFKNGKVNNIMTGTAASNDIVDMLRG